jgi:hypothetical protein
MTAGVFDSEIIRRSSTAATTERIHAGRLAPRGETLESVPVLDTEL